MNYWWVNQKQTHRHEIGEGYMWSPKIQQDGRKHFSYEFMKHIQPGDIIFSYANAAIVAVGIAKTHCYSFPKPLEFGKAGIYWQDEGWKVDVSYRRLSLPLRTMDHIQNLRGVLPDTKSPIQADTGGDNQAYLFQIGEPMALALAHLIDGHTVALVSGKDLSETDTNYDSIDEQLKVWEDKLEDSIVNDNSLVPTEKETLIKARRGQGKFRSLLLNRELYCRVTGVDQPEHLIASHIKPWRSATNDERLDPENGFMFTPSIDHLFDKGFISFENDGSILLADIVHRPSMESLGVIGGNAPKNIGLFSQGQKQYLEWHREYLLLK